MSQACGLSLKPPCSLLRSPARVRAPALRARWINCTLAVQRAERQQAGGAGGGRGGGGGGGGQPRRRQGGRNGKAGSSSSSNDGKLRLNKAVAAAGLASRRGADDLIFAGRVKVNGQVVTEPGMQVDLRSDKVAVDGRQVTAAAMPRKFYFAVNKPKGYLCSNKAGDLGEEGDGRLVIDLLQPWLRKWEERNAAASKERRSLPPRLFTVGRLDVQSIGLIFVTNDGDWANKVMHPSSGVTKEYSVTLNRKPSKEQLDRIAAGCMMDGVFVTPLALARDDTDATKPDRIRIVVAEGRNREVRNLVEHAGLEVKTLRRTRIGGYRLPRDLAFGQVRELAPNEARRVLDLGADRRA